MVLKSASQSPLLVPCRLLIVDDLVDHAQTLARLLELIGHEARAVYGAAEALALAEQFRPDMILTDINMPNMDGYELTKRIRAQDWGRKIVICAITGCDRAQHRALSREAGIDHHLLKPLELEQLLPLIPQSS